jgi:hypothetical protein
MKSLIDALEKENVKQGLNRPGVRPGKKVNPKRNAVNPATKGSVGQKGRFMKLIGAA